LHGPLPRESGLLTVGVPVALSALRMDSNIPLVSKRSSGFTLVETMIVVSVTAILSAFAAATMSGLKERSSFSDAVAEVTGGLALARAESIGRGAYTAFVLDAPSGQWWSLEVDEEFDVSDFDPDDPGTVMSSGTLPSTAKFSAPSTSLALLPAPFAQVPVKSTQSPALPYCSFCLSTGRGSVVFQPGSQPVFSAGPSTNGQQFMLRRKDGVDGTRVVAILGHNGLTEVFSR
jgi:prepilin-type N-terminal cleavage/methylation domain-containing protein